MFAAQLLVLYVECFEVLLICVQSVCYFVLIMLRDDDDVMIEPLSIMHLLWMVTSIIDALHPLLLSLCIFQKFLATIN